ncbi:MAG: glycosyltransferase family 1 protein [Chloroflexota bacterium]|nr:glycosyltransferase family 1 protein [Chloroflexota bacterium]
MRIGINEVLIYNRSSGARQREINVLPQVLRQIEASGGESVVYVARDLEDGLVHQLTGNAHNVTVVRTPLPSIPTYQRILKGIPYWRRRVVRDRLDIFHTTYYPIPQLPVPIVLIVNDVRFVHLPDTYPRLRCLFLRLVVPSSLRRATRIISISQDTKEDLIRFFGVTGDKIDVVHIVADPRFRPVADMSGLAQVRRRYGLPERLILYVGHLEPRKNLDRLVQAFVQLRDQDVINHHLVILGKPSFGFESMLDQVKRSDLTFQVVFTGYVEDEDMPAVYTLADVLAFPSLHEGFGIPVLEAMACGVPVITSNVSALPEIAGDAAILVDPYDVESIAGGIALVLSDENVRRQLIEKGLERVKRFSAEKSAAAIVETYKKTLNLE